jgi:cytochrome c oxidase subunit 4
MAQDGAPEHFGADESSLIMAFFMHLRFERLSLVYAIVAPLILLIAMIAGLVPDGVAVWLRR